MNILKAANQSGYDEEAKQLKPCPFCAHDNPAIIPIFSLIQEFEIFCGKCHAKSSVADTVQEAINKWNRRDYHDC